MKETFIRNYQFMSLASAKFENTNMGRNKQKKLRKFGIKQKKLKIFGNRQRKKVLFVGLVVFGK